jgi:hypothetical protein
LRMKIDVLCSLSKFRRFMIMSTCISFMPPAFIKDEEIFPERNVEKGTMYVEAADKETIQATEETSFVRVSEVLGVIYNSKSGKTRLKWRSLRGDLGKLTGDASSNSLVNLYASGVLDRSYANVDEWGYKRRPDDS